MPKLLTSKEDHIERFNIWAQRVRDINGVEWPDSFEKKYDNNNKYTRFTGYVKEWMHGILSSDSGKRAYIHKSERLDDVYLDGGLAKDWWKLAMKRSNGKNIEKGLPGAKFYEENKRSEIYDKFMPAYKAIKESYDKRPWYEWIFNHAQYTAERDALKAIKGMILELTMDEPRAFESAYNEYTATVSLNEEIEQNEEVEQNYIENDKESRISIGNEVERDLNKTVMKRPAKLFADQLGEKLNDKSQSHETAIERGTDAILKDCVDHEREGIIEALRKGQFQQIAQDLNQKVDMQTDKAEKHRIMVEGTKEIFKKAYTQVLNNVFDDDDKRIIIAQKITDLYLRVYSPAGFDKAEFGKYASNYIVSQDDEETKQECFLDLHEGLMDEELDDVLVQVRDVLGINKEKLHIENESSNTEIQKPFISDENSELNVSRDSLNSNF